MTKSLRLFVTDLPQVNRIRPLLPGSAFVLGTRCCVYFASCLSMKSAMMWVASMDSGKDASYQKA